MSKLIKNSLGYDSDLWIYQDKDMFNYSVDTIMLGNFVTINSKIKKVIDIGTNNGALAIFIAARAKKLVIDAIEIQKESVEIAEKNIEMNKMKNQINLIHEDFKDYFKKVNKTPGLRYDLVVCNPPFYKVDSSIPQPNTKLALATHEHLLTLEELIYGASKIIKQGGRFAIVHQTSRLVDIIYLLRENGFEPKRIQMMHPRETDPSHLVLVEARYKVGWGTEFLKPLFLHKDNVHEYREEIKELYKPIKKEL